MLTEYRRADLDKMMTASEIRTKFHEEGKDKHAIGPMTVGWMSSQQERLLTIAREALDEVDKLKARLDELERIAETHLGTEDDSPYAAYWDKHYDE
jgi:hypothetical protein